MYQDYKDLLSAFHAHGVKYLIVGGYAVIFPRLLTSLSQQIRPNLNLHQLAVRILVPASVISVPRYGWRPTCLVLI